MDIESSIQESLLRKTTTGALSMEHHSKVHCSIGSSYTNVELLQTYTQNGDGSFTEGAKLANGDISEALNLTKETIRSSSDADGNTDRITHLSLNNLFESSDEFYPKYWIQQQPPSNTIPTRGSSSHGFANEPKAGDARGGCASGASHQGTPKTRTTREGNDGQDVVPTQDRPVNSTGEEIPPLSHVGAKPTGGSTPLRIARRLTRDRCRVARQIAVRWMSSLTQSPPTSTRIESYRACRGPSGAFSDGGKPTASTPAKPISNSRDGAHSDPANGVLSSDLSRKSGMSRSFDSAMNSTAPSSLTSTGSSGHSMRYRNQKGGGGSHANSFCTDAVSTKESEKHPGQVGASPFTYDELDLVPSDVSSIPPLLNALREIALSCASLELFAKPINGSSGQVEGNKGTFEGQRCGKGGQRRRSPPPSPAMSSCSTEPGAKVDTDVHEEQWNAVRSHFATVRRLVLNDEELVKTLDSALGVDWRPEPSWVADLDGGTTQEDGDAKGMGSEATSLVAASAQSTPNTVAVHTNTHRSATHMDGIIAANDLQGDAADAVGDASGILKTHSPLNHNAPAFHSRTSFALTESSTYYSPSRQVASFPSELSMPPGTAPYDGCGDPKRFLVGYPDQSSGLLSDASPTTFSEKESGKDARQQSAKPSKPAALHSSAKNPHSTTSPAIQTSKSGPSSSSVSSPPITFCLESREDMMRRRSAAPHAFFSAALPPHRGGAAYYSTTSVASPLFSAVGPPPLPKGHAESSPLDPGSDTKPSSGNSNRNGGGGLLTPGRAGPPRSHPVSPLLAFTSPALLPQCPYDYLLVLDFEATCEEHAPPGYLHEILEFPVVLVDTRLQRVMAEFHRFVRPRHKPRLSAFCRALTGIRQDDVDAAETLEVVVAQFERWYRQTIPANARAIFATDGPADFREFMYNHSVARQGIRFPAMFYQWVDIKKSFAAFFNCQQGKIQAMLDALHMPFKGRLHNGLDDARNLANIVIGLLQRGCTFCEVPLSRLSPGAPSSRGGGALEIPGGCLFLPPSAVSLAAAATSSSNGNSSFAHPNSEPPYSIENDDSVS